MQTLGQNWMLLLLLSFALTMSGVIVHFLNVKNIIINHLDGVFVRSVIAFLLMFGGSMFFVLFVIGVVVAIINKY
jgi:hypothetical protein